MKHEGETVSLVTIVKGVNRGASKGLSEGPPKIQERKVGMDGGS